MFYYYNGFSLIRKYGICMLTVYAHGRFKVTDRRSRVPFLWTRMTFQHEKPREIASTDTNDRSRFAAIKKILPSFGQDVKTAPLLVSFRRRKQLLRFPNRSFGQRLHHLVFHRRIVQSEPHVPV